MQFSTNLASCKSLTCTLSQIPQQCANDCAETGDGSLDGDGGAAASLGLNSEVEDGKGYT